MTWTVVQSDALEWLRSLPDDSADLLFTSPPYEAQRTYGVGFRLRGQAWVDWLRPVVAEACRVVNGLVCVNAAGPVEGGRYSPSMEWLVADLTRLDGLACGPAPYAWTKNGVPGSGADHYQRRDWEPVYCFARPEKLPLRWSDNTAFGIAPKYRPGGVTSHRGRNGVRVNHTKRRAGGVMERQVYDPPAVANPGNVLHVRVGGGRLGHDLAHENEAPMPVALAERFVCWFAPPGGLVLDCFAGSGTTAHAAVMHGRRFAGCDLRQSQVSLTRRRMATVTPSMFSGVTDGD